MKVFHKGLILVGVPLLVEVVLIASLAFLLIKSDEAQLREIETRKFSAATAKMSLLAFEAPYALFLALQTGSEKGFQIFERDRAKVLAYRDIVVEGMDNFSLAPDLNKRFVKVIDNMLAVLDELSQLRHAGGAISFLSKSISVRYQFDQVSREAKELFEKYRVIGDEMSRKSHEDLSRLRAMQTNILVSGVAANILVGIALMFFYRHSIQMRIETIRQNTLRLKEGEPLDRELEGSDEIRLLDASFHQMAAELAAASEREMSLFNNASDVICVLDGQGRFTKINPACLRLWGYEPEDLIFTSLETLLPESEWESTRSSILSARQLQVPVSFESRIRKKGGKVLEVLWSAFWSEREQSLFCVVHDITERKNAERLKKHFLSIISSDLRAPLSAISASVSDLLTNRSEGLSKMAVDKLEMARKNVGRLLGLVNDLLQLTELETGQLKLNKRECSVEEILRRSAQDVEGVSQKLKVSVEINNTASSWLVDPDRIMQVTVNLLSNAVKFSPEGSAVTVSAEDRQDEVEVKVIDRGRGIPASHKEAIFEKFKQVSAADGKRKSGTGLGLPICKQIVEEHGGCIGVDSDEGKGSTFWFRVPKQEPERAEAVHSPDAGRLSQASESTREAGSIRGTSAVPEPTGMEPAGQTSGSGQRGDGPGAGSEHSSRRQTGSEPQRHHLSLMQKGMVLIGIPIIFEIAFVGMLSILLIQGGEERSRELHSRLIAVKTNQLLQSYFEIGSLISTDNPRGREAAWNSIHAALERSVVLRTTIRDHVRNVPGERDRFQEAEDAMSCLDRFHERAVDIIGDYFLESNYREVREMRKDMLPCMAKVMSKLQKLVDLAEKKESISPDIQKRLRTLQGQILLVGLATNLLLSVLLAIYFSRDVTYRLRTLANNTERLSREEKLNPLVTGTDEIAQLDQEFHATAQAVMEARHKERAVFDNSKDVICSLDADGCFTSLNPAVETMWQYSPRELIGRPLLEIVYSDDKEQTSSALLGPDGEQSLSRALEDRIVRKDGSIMWVMWSISTPPGQSAMFCIAHDINNRKELEQLKQDFLAVVSHDLRTPLTSITGVAKLMQAGAMGAISDPVKDKLDEIVENADRLLELINDILDIEKLEAGHLQLILENVGLGELMEKSINCAPGKAKANLRLEVPQTALEIRADRDRLMQAVSNVLGHAIQTSPSGAPVLVRVASQDGVAEIRIRDAAPPLSEDACKQIFERFKDAVREPEHRQNTGTGLALPIAKKIVESHGGQIGVDASPGDSGNEFWIRLPLATVTASP